MPRTAPPANAPLTRGNAQKKGQRAHVAMVRSRAYKYQDSLGLVHTDQATWNAEQTAGIYRRKRGLHDTRTSLTQGTQADFALLMAHFHELAGDHQAATYWYQRDETGLTQTADANDTPETRRQEIYLLRAECQKKNLPFPQYPLAIAHKRHWITPARATLHDLTPHEIFTLKITVKAKAKARPADQTP